MYTFREKIKPSISKFLLAILFVGFSWSSPSLAFETLSIATRDDALTNRFSEQVLVEAYGRLNINVEFISYPGARSILEADLGRADGEVARLDIVLDQYANMRIVPVALFKSELSAFVHNEYKFDISGWNSLDGHSTVIVRGFKFIEQMLEGKSPHIVVNSTEAIKLVENNKVEVAILNSFLGQAAIATTGSKNVVMAEVPLDSRPVYHLLNKKHKDLIPKLTSVLKDMETDGTLRAMWDKFSADELLKASK